MTTARCSCGSVTWELGGPMVFMSHCHCSRCRKAHGGAYATYVGGPLETYRMSGEEHVVRWESSPGVSRCFCRRCGSVVPGAPYDKLMFVPAGNFDDDPGHRPDAHILVASKAPWFEITDSLPRFDAYPPSIDMPTVADREPLDPPGKTRGSCLCGGVTFVVDEGEVIRSVHCHCSRCRRARSAAFASNLVKKLSAVRFTKGEELLAEFKDPDAKYFTQVFCRVCGSPMPRRDAARDIVVIPMGCLDDDPGVRPSMHIFVASKAAWDTIHDSLPQHAEGPPTRQ